MLFRPRALLCFAVLCCTLSVAWAAEPVSSISRKKPRLVVNIVVGQMRYDYLLRFADNFSGGGFHHLVRDGVLCTNASYDYALTRTGPGLATISTGANPTSHGVVGDRWFNYTTLREIQLAHDPSVLTIGSDAYDGQYSPRGLIAPSLGDQLKSSSSDSKVVSIALDPASAVVMGGHTPNAVYWLNPREGCWVTSNYYAKELPEWVRKINNDGIAASYCDPKWVVSKPKARYHNSQYADILLDTTKVSFDFLTRKKYDYACLTTSPAGNTLLRDFAVQAVIHEGLGNDDATDLLTLVFDASRHIGERYGTGSIELEDSYYRLDQELASLLEFLETHTGREHLLVVLTSDHGASDPVVDNQQRLPAGRFNASYFSALIAGFLGAQLGPDEWLLKVENRQIYLNRKLLYERGHNLEDIQARVANFAIQFSGVSQAVTSAALQSGHFSGGVLGKIQNSFFARNSGDVVLNLMPGWIDESDKVSDSGSPYNYDTHVPLIWFGSGVGNDDIQRPVNITDIAPTIANLIGIPPPQASTGSIVFELLNRNQTGGK